MRRNKLGRTDVEVSEICLGTMTWGLQNTEADAHVQLDYALDHDINFVDTAELYAVPPSAETYGLTERYIGTWLKKTGRREEIVLASKISGGGRPWIRNGEPPTRTSVRVALEDSLLRLQTDYVDLYQIHWPARGHYHFTNHWSYDPFSQDKRTAVRAIEETLEAIDELVREGKIRHFGLSNETAWGTMQYLRLAEERGWPRVVSIQNEYNLLRRYHDTDLAELAHHEDVGLLAYSPLGGGVLSGKYVGGAMPEGSRGAISGGIYRHNAYTEPAIRAYMELAESYGIDVCQMALSFCRSRPFMTSVIIGATSIDQLKTDIGAADEALSDEIVTGIQDIYKRFPRPL